MVTTQRRMPNYSVLIYDSTTPTTRLRYPVVWAERVKRTSLASWERRVVFGQPSADAEEIISSWTQDDYSGGIGIVDANESTDLQTIAFGVIDLRSPGQVVLPPETLLVPPPSWATGPSIPLGDVVTTVTGEESRMYVAWTDHAAAWDEATRSWTSFDNDLNKTPIDTGTQFGGWLFVPCGADGAVALRQDTHATGELAIENIPAATFAARCFGTWNNSLYAMSHDNRLWALSSYDCEITGPVSGWTKVAGDISGELILDRTHRPTKLFTYYNREGKEVLWCVTNKGAFMFYFDGPDWIRTTIKPSPHPSFGVTAVPWREEDLFIASGGLGVARRTPGDVNVPIAGPNAKQGVPPEYAGQFYDLEGEQSTLYGIVGGLPSDSSATIGELAGPGLETPHIAAPAVSQWLAAWTGTSWCCLYEDRETTALPTRMHLSTATDSYRLWWGDSDGVMRTQQIPLDFYNPRAKIVLQRDPFMAEGWMDTFRYDANMTGWDKIASHCFSMTDYASSDEYVDVYYRTNLDYPDQDAGANPLGEPAYQLWKRVDRSGRALLWFDDVRINPRTGLPWHEGQLFQWIQFRFRFYRGSNVYLSPVWESFSTHHIRVPQDAASYVVKIPFFDGPGGRGHGRRSGKEMAQTLRAMQRSGAMIHLQPNNYETIRGRIVGIAEEAWVGGETFSSVMVLNIVEIGASTNANQYVA